MVNKVLLIISGKTQLKNDDLSVSFLLYCTLKHTIQFNFYSIQDVSCVYSEEYTRASAEMLSEYHAWNNDGTTEHS